MPPKPLQVIETDDECSLTDAQIKALKDLSPDEIRLLKHVAETSKAIQIIMAVVAGIIATISFFNASSIKQFLAKIFS